MSKASEEQIKAVEQYALRMHLYFQETPKVDYDTILDVMSDGKYPEGISPLDMFDYEDSEDIADSIDSMKSTIIDIIEMES